MTMNRTIARARRTVRERQVLLILSQDTGGAFEYLRQTLDKRLLRPELVLSVQGAGTSSKTMLSDARRALSGRSIGLPRSSYVFLVMDRDQDPGLDNVLAATREMPFIEPFVSTPCIEYYFMLHFSSSRPPMNNFSDLQPHLRELDGFGRYSKSKAAVPISLLGELEATARVNAKKSRQACFQEGSAGPKSDLDLLFDAIDDAQEGGLEQLLATRTVRNVSREPQ